MTTHRLKTWPVFYDDVECGAKTFEIRKNDRNFQVGDILILEKYDPDKKEYDGSSLEVSVDYTIHLNGLPGMPDDFIAMSISLLDESKSKDTRKPLELSDEADADIFKRNCAYIHKSFPEHYRYCHYCGEFLYR